MRNTKPLVAMPYYGGKARYLSKWILSHLPTDTSGIYVEPFAGMLGVLLNRPIAQLEMVNDTDERIVNWWRVVRNHPAELERLLHCTPWSRTEFADAVIPSDDPIENARRFTVLVSQNLMRGSNAGCGGWGVGWRRTFLRGGATLPNPSGLIADKIEQIAARIYNVQIENCCGIELLERTSQNAEAVVYADPPYYTAITSPYRDATIDIERMTEVLLKHRGRVAISGYGDEWAHLDWRCETYNILHSAPKYAASARVEKLWMNYPRVVRQTVLL